MKKTYTIKCLCWLLFGFYGIIGCHQEPIIPQSAIPPSCRLYQLVNINEGVRDTTVYVYNDFGLIAKITHRKWANGQSDTKIDQDFTYTADHYLLSQVNRTSSRAANGNLIQQAKGYNYTYKDGHIEQMTIVDNASGTKLGFKLYTYEGDKLKSYEETDGNRTIIKRYTLDATGKLMNYEEPGSGVIATLTNGKIVKRLSPNGTTVTYTYDLKGQLTQQVISSGTGRVEYTYSYDSMPYWDKTQLRLRGIPSPDLGEHIQLNNQILYSSKRYQDEQLISEQSFSYKHDYNKNGYSRGYGRSDGARQINYYSNCL